MKFSLFFLLLISFSSQMAENYLFNFKETTEFPNKIVRDEFNTSKLAIQDTTYTFPLNTTWQDYPVDDDHNGFYNRLVVDMGFYITHDNFGVYGILFDNFENILGTADFRSYNDESFVSLSFPGQPIYANAKNGPYVLRVSLFTPSWYGYINYGELNYSMTYETSFELYNSSHFERPRAIITGFSDYGIDSDSDSYYDEIVIEIETEVSDYGFYQLSAYFEHSILVRDSELEISRHWDGYLQPGQNIVEIQIQASEFFKRNQSDHIRVNYVHFTLYGEPQHILTNAYNTTSVFYHDLVHSPIELTGNFWDRGVDTDSNTLYNELEIIFEVNFTRAGYYTIILALNPEVPQNPSFSYEESLNEYWNQGIVNISVKFDEIPFYSIFNITTFLIQDLIFRNNSWENILLFRARPYTTGEYSHSEFELPHIFPTGRFWDQGHDSDLNSYFDRISIIFEVNVTSINSCNIYFELRPAMTTDYRWRKYFSETRYFGTVGVQNVSTTIDTESFYSIRKNVSFIIEYFELFLEYEMYFRSESIYTTQEYQYTRFEKPAVYLTGNFSEFGVDHDFNGVFEELAITFEVNSAQASDYNINVRIKEINAKNVWDQDIGTYEHLNNGLNYVDNYFDMSTFYSANLNTSFIVDYIEIHDENWNRIDFAYSFYTTQFYERTEFEVPAVFVTGNYSDNGQDLNENGKIDELVIQVEVDAVQTGVYNFELRIAPLIPVWDTTRWISFDRTLQPGIQNITLQMYVTLPYAYRLDTAFIIEELIIREIEEWQEVFRIDSPYVTRVYQYLEFDYPGIYFTGNYWETELDTDSNGLIDRIRFELEVNTTKAGYYFYNYNYYSTDWYQNQGDYLEEYFSEGIRNISILINTKLLYSYFDDLTITLEHCRLHNNQGYMMDRTFSEYNTRIYSFNEFDPPGAYLGNNYLDYGIDIDQDGNYEKLALEIGVNVIQSGTYILNLDLQVVPSWDYLRKDSLGYWEIGEYSININVSASELPLNYGNNEQIYINLYYVEILEYAGSNELLSYQYYPYTTRAYSPSRFDTSIDVSSTLPEYPTLNGQNILFGGILLLLISSFFLVKQKKSI
ncbi:MAG: hypothetical protein ACXABU_05065 [Candidatus Hodarchaeales archaeon]